MDVKLTLFSELCACIGPQPQAVHAALWSCLSRYAIASNAAVTSFASSLHLFLAAKQVDGLSAKTIQEYRRILTSFDCFTALPPARITTDHIRSYLAHLTTRGLKASSVQSYANSLRSFFSWLLAEEQLERNPMAKIRSRRLDKQHTRQPLTAKEVEKARSACRNSRECALFELFVSSGCRISEIRSIARNSIDFQSRTFPVTGKGDKTRTVFFSARAALALEKYMKETPGGIYLFAHPPAPGRPLSIRSIQRILQAIGERARLPARLHPHKLRHTFATSAINHGMALAVVQQLLGHESADTTQIYAKLATRTISRAYNKCVA